ncbi:MAG: NAD-binding protein, partial [Cyclobacteriaceae bacterium]|nr:NAD-binding protein [Cyclobacteriaceae bacterium HetDA_MAG_MS6]
MELLDVFRRLKTAGAAFGIVLLFGSSGYYWISGGQASMVDAFYMTAITISTIGFHEVIDLSASPYGRLFTVFLAFSGFGVLTYFISNVVALFIEGDLRRTFEKKKMEKMIHKIENHYIICGCGRVGRNIASELQATERPFVMADISQENIDKLVQDFPKMPYLIGDATDEDFLIKLGLERA